MCNDTPLRIMHAAAPGHAGGLESVVLDLASGFRSRGHAVLLATVLDPGAEDHPVPARAEQAGIEVQRLVVPPRDYIGEYRSLRRLIRAWAPDVVHTHGYRADLLAGAAARHEQVPWVSTVHGFTGGDRKNRLYEWLQCRAYRKAQGVIAVSRSVREKLELAGVPASLVHVVPNAWIAKPSLDRDASRRELGLANDGPHLGWVGRLSREKGADVFLRALGLLRDLPWHASILGDGRERAALETLALELGLGDRVTWHGLVPDASRCFAAFDLYVLSSRTEGTPIALFEAMAAGVPVIATAVGGVPDVVSSGEAVLVPADDPAALAEALRGAITDPHAARQRAEAGAERLRNTYAGGPWLDAHGRLYRGIAGI